MGKGGNVIDKKPDKIVQRAVSLLEGKYGIPSPKPYKDPLEELIFTILSQNTNDRNRDRAHDALCARFSNWEEVMEADPAEIAEAIKIGGLANQKSVRIKNILTAIHRVYGKLDLDFLKDIPLQEGIELLSSFKGVGPKTVACVLLFACDRPIFPVDTHIFRIATRLNLLPEKCNDVKAHRIMNTLVAPEKVYSFHMNVITLGREICKPAKPKCHICPLKDVCCFENKQTG